MKVRLKQNNKAFHFTAVGDSGFPVDIDAAPGIGGEGKGARPMELMLMGLGGCTAIDVIQILKKQRQPVVDLKIEIESRRREAELPAVFEWILIKYIFTGNLDKSKVEKAINISFEKYCSASAILGKTAKIEHSFEIILC